MQGAEGEEDESVRGDRDGGPVVCDNFRRGGGPSWERLEARELAEGFVLRRVSLVFGGGDKGEGDVQ